MPTFVFQLRDITRISGLTREILVAVTTNIDSREWRWKFISQNGLPPEHPRACQTDDVECFFSTLRDVVGKPFYIEAGTHKMYMYM